MPSCEKQLFLRFSKKDGSRVIEVDIWKIPGKQPFFFNTGMSIDADGAPNAYDLANRGGLTLLRQCYPQYHL